jgi:hypothetical protein
MESDQPVVCLASWGTAGLLNHLADFLSLGILDTLLVGIHAEEEEHQDDNSQGGDGNFFGVHRKDFLR